MKSYSVVNDTTLHCVNCVLCSSVRKCIFLKGYLNLMEMEEYLHMEDIDNTFRLESSTSKE
ncbi:hypothetical protein BDB00DRAFT_857959 [Zychaea mexicana]|uniref:uncharacterized protein n=1 Tax=Zychaea mexicana TaxID=64656 RepID=UPI0022FEE85D|nr:uncharacterized protein BDB00DRAFT_857959 [Zychaea mexicana]KAI9480244.1 hypothetical protein BDB00DRAFT_857959 [Zychaea mexicana]